MEQSIGDGLIDEFGRTLEEQLQEQVIHEYWISRDHYLKEEYNSDTDHFDGEDLPHGIQIIYQNGGAQYSVERYLPRWHYREAVELLDESYEALLTRSNKESTEEELVADGGQQIPNPQLDSVWFWYDPAADWIIQEEVEPYEVVGLFQTRGDATQFIERYADQYDLEDTTHFELYRAELEYVDNGPLLEPGSEDGEEDLPEQAGLGQFHQEGDR